MKFTRICFIFIFPLLISGCQTIADIDEATLKKTARFYSGAPRSQNEVALIIRADYRAILESLDGLMIDQTCWEGCSLYGRPKILEVLPGQHVIGISYYVSFSSGGKTVRSTGKTVQVYIDAKPGNLYFYYAEITDRVWKPVIVNLDDQSIPTKKLRSYKRIKKEVVPKYFSGERPVFAGLDPKQ